MGLLVALRLFAEPPVWAYWAILAGAALIAPYWAYRDIANERDALKTGLPLRAQVERILHECEKYRAAGAHPFDAQALVADLSRLLAAFPDEPSLEALRKANLDIKTVPPESIVLNAQRDLRFALVELDQPPKPSDEERMEAAKTLLREASTRFFDDLTSLEGTAVKAKLYLGWAYNLLVAIFGEESVQAKMFLIRQGSDELHRIESHPRRETIQYAEALGQYPDFIQLPPGRPGDPSHLLRADFIPKPGKSWKDY